MSSSAVQSFSDPDALAEALRADVEFTITERGRYTTKLINIQLRRLEIRRWTESLARVAHVFDPRKPVVIQFCTEPHSKISANGLEFQSTKVVRHSLNVDYNQASSGSVCWGAMCLPPEELADIGESMVGRNLMQPGTALISPEPAAMARLQRLHAAAAQLAETAPEIIANAHAAEGLEQTLLDAMIGCLRHEDAEHSIAGGQHAIVMRRFRRILEGNPDRPIYISEICKTIGVSDNTLRACCNEHLGMGPRRYLAIRRLHLARRALRNAAPGASTVTDIATRYGFWHLARFAGEYKSLFGEPPSGTLRR